MSEARRALLVGGAGYIGSVMTGRLLGQGWRVRCFDKLIYKNQSTVWPYLSDANYEFMLGDVRDATQCELALWDVQDVVLLAGLVGDPITKAYPEESESINFRGLCNFLAVAARSGVERLVFVSTCSNYGLVKEDIAVAEDFPVSPLSLYAKHKVEIEQEILSAKGRVSYQPTILRFATAFGLSHRTRFDLTVNEFTRELYAGGTLRVFDAKTWRPYCHVRDFARAVERVLRAPASKVGFEVFNVGSEENNYTKQMIVDEITKHIPAARVEYKEHGSDPRNYRVEFGKIRRVLDFTPEVGVPSGIKEIISACEKGLFDHVDEQKHFFGNYKIF